MADFRPFMGVHYDWSRFKAGDVVCPPYDVIRKDRRHWAEKSPHNAVHLVLGGEIGGDWHEEAGTRFLQWRREGVLVQDPEPFFYAYEHRFSMQGRELRRVGFVGLLRLEEEEGEVVRPHEHTFPKPRADRLRLMETCRANLESIFLLFPDPKGEIRGVIESTEKSRAIEVLDEYETLHRFWPISDPVSMETIRQQLGPSRLLVADGHHRFSTAKTFRDLEWEKKGRDPEAPWNFMMVYATAVQDSALRILPTHRVLLRLPEGLRNDPLEALSAEYELLPFEDGAVSMAGSISDPEGSGPSLGVYHQGRAWLISRKSGKGHPGGEGLPVSFLHEEILPKVFGLPSRLPEDMVGFFRNPAEAADMVDSGQGVIAFFLRPVSPETVWDLAGRGEMMPQKSTDFFPKLLSGLVFHTL